jgi:hypothetical protein
VLRNTLLRIKATLFMVVFKKEKKESPKKKVSLKLKKKERVLKRIKKESFKKVPLSKKVSIFFSINFDPTYPP